MKNLRQHYGASINSNLTPPPKKMNTMKIKPLSVNECWQGMRFKTDKYKSFERELLFTLPKITLPDKPFTIIYHFGFSNMRADVDNPVKPLMDILCKKYGFNDADVHSIQASKTKTEKGKEFISFSIETFKN